MKTAEHILKHPFGYIIVTLILVGYTCIGIYHNLAGNVTTMSKFVYGGKKITLFPIIISIFIVFFDAMSVKISTSQSYKEGLKELYQIIGATIGICFAIFIFCPVIYKAKCRTVYEYLEKRFGIITRKVGCLHLVLCVTLYASQSMNTAGNAIKELSLVSEFGSVVILLLVAVTYLIMGGVKAVTWISTIQGIIMYATLITTLILASKDIGSLENIKKTAVKGRLDENIKFSLFFTGNNFWSILIHYIMYYSYIYGMSPLQWQLAMCCDSFKKFRLSLFLASVLDVLTNTIFVFFGILMYASLVTCGSTPNASDTKEEITDFLTFFVKKHCMSYVGLTGFTFFGLEATSITSIASMLYVMSFITLQDIVLPLFPNENLSDERQLLMIKFLINFLAGIMFFCTFSIASIKAFRTFIEVIMQGFYSTQTALFTLGVLFPRVNEKGLLISILFGNIFVIWIALGKALTVPDYNLVIPGCPKPNTTTDNSSFAFYETFYQTNWLSSPNISIFEGNYDNFENNSWKNLTTKEKEQQTIFPLFYLSDQWINIFAFFIMIMAAYYISMVTGIKSEVSPELLSPLTRFWIGKKFSGRQRINKSSIKSALRAKSRKLRLSVTITTPFKLSRKRRIQKDT